MENTLSVVCDQLDELMLRILELLEKQVKCRVELEEAMKPGFVHIAKSRYIMGNQCVGSSQLPTEDSAEFEAVATVQQEEPTKDREHQVYKLVDTSQCWNKISNDVGLRQRKEKHISDGLEGDRSPVDTSKEKTPKASGVNPIKWFGVLVPQNLRMAQNCFQMVLPLVIECANVQNELQCVQQTYNKLLKEKQLLS